jgi:hypothetical protein
VATAAVSLAKVAVVDPGEVGRSAMHNIYNNGPGTLPWGTPALAEDSSVNSVSTFTRNCLETAIMAVGIRHVDHVVALTSSTSGGRFVGVVRSRTQATEF